QSYFDRRREHLTQADVLVSSADKMKYYSAALRRHVAHSTKIIVAYSSIDDNFAMSIPMPRPGPRGTLLVPDRGSGKSPSTMPKNNGLSPYWNSRNGNSARSELM